jgi:regulator of replication initiation timing
MDSAKKNMFQKQINTLQITLNILEKQIEDIKVLNDKVIQNNLELLQLLNN